MFEEKTGKALEEARTKLDTAVDYLINGGPDVVKKIWYAEEAAEYSSILYSLTYGLEDENPPPPVRRRNADPVSLVKESKELLRRATELRAKSPSEGYGHLRTAVDKLRQSHHIVERSISKKS
ncbi:MAG TPA: hypothetical protein VFE96_02425 [Candidatus Bathyarchaeia archaeon]|nr:hypothetical protein [Candidatus Bathyarchaeia archaeon]